MAYRKLFIFLSFFLAFLINYKNIAAQNTKQPLPIVYSDIKCDTIYCKQVLIISKLNFIVKVDGIKYIYKNKNENGFIEWHDNKNNKIEIFMYFINGAWKKLEDNSL